MKKNSESVVSAGLAGVVRPANPDAVPDWPRQRIRHPLRGTPLAVRYRRIRRWLNASVHAARYNARLAGTAPTLNFYPRRPPTKAQITRILPLLGVRIGFNVDGEGSVIAWDGDTWFDQRHAARLPAGTINGRCLDVSKSTVGRAFADVASYSLTVDPLTTAGPIVVKTELNGMHDARLVEGPLSSLETGVVYQRFIDTHAGEFHSTVRVPVIGRRLPVVLIKWRRSVNRFSGPARAEPRPTAELYSADEMEIILRFAERIGMDYGELDVMRETSSGRIYVVDANRTPMRSPWLPDGLDGLIYPPMAEAFAELLEL